MTAGVSALRRAAEETGIPLALAADWFEPVAMIAAHSVWVTSACSPVDDRDFAELGVTDKLHAILSRRLEMLHWSRKPSAGADGAGSAANLYTGTRLTWDTVDAAWNAVGPADRDFNHVTKRTLLAGVYGATLTYWLANGDDDLEATAVSDRRLREVVRIFGRIWLPKRMMGA